jgi:DNA polymerase elongation subunit (family B)
MEIEQLFIYQWHFEEVDGVTVIRIFGINKSNESVYVSISDFTPYIYLELPENISWNQGKAQILCNYFDSNMNSNKALKKSLVFKKRLYYAHKEIDKDGIYKDKFFPYLFMSFSTPTDIKKFSYFIRKNIRIPGLGEMKFKIHESDANPILQLICVRNIQSCGWIKIRGKLIEGDEKESSCDKEYLVRYKNIELIESDLVPNPLIMGMDIEVNSSNPNAMPDVNKIPDKIFQIACVFARQGQVEDKWEKVLLSLGNPDQETTGKEVEIRSFKTEGELLEGYTDLIQEKNPQIIVGYNIFMFDIPYMIDRAKLNYSFKFNMQGFLEGKQGKERMIKWSSSAYGTQEFKFLDCEGRLFVDLLPLIKRDYKFDTYSLKAVSTSFLGQTKDPLTHKGIFKCYRLFTPKSLAVCGKYCLTGDTKIMLRYRSESIENLKNYRNDLLSFSEEKNGLIYSKQNNHFNNGIEDCLEIELIDGTKISCTKNHKIMLNNTSWEEAGTLKVGDYLKCGLTFPHINIEEEFKTCHGFDFELFKIDNIQDMEKGFAFSRLLGYLLTDGSISGGRGFLYIGCKMDLEDIICDLKILTEITVKSYINGYVYRVELPKKIMEIVLKLNNIRTGSRTNQNSKIPDIVYKFPLPFLREFLGGLMGGDGHTISFNKIENKLNSTAFSQTIKTEKIESLISTFKDYQVLFKKFNIITLLGNPKKPGELKDDCKTLELRISTKSLIDFEDLIGFRYCYHKSYRLKIATSFYKVKSEKIRFYNLILSQIKERVNQGFSICNSYNFIKEQYYKDISIPTRETFNSRFNTNFENYVFRDKNTFEGNCKKFLTETGSLDLLSFQDLNKKSYSLEKDAESIPTFYLPIKSIKNIGQKQVYDIEVDNTHNFIANGIVVHNCVQDSNLTVKLFEKLQYWVGLCEMAKTCNIPIFYTYTQGQQIKIFSQVYKKCMYDNYVVEKDGYIAKEDERYTGAYVFNPEPGLYDMIVSFDFSSLYPTTIIAYNIDYTTLVKDESIPDEKCNIFMWKDCQGCCHDTTVRKTKIKKEDVMCVERKFRFLKEPKGVIPTLLENLLGARKTTNKQISNLEERLKTEQLTDNEKAEIKSLITVLDKRQLAYKVSANSMYGAMGTRRGYLPFLPGAMCTTARGRQSIEKAAKHLQDVHKAHLVYGDSCTGDTPIILNVDNKIQLTTFNDFKEGLWTEYRGFKDLTTYNIGISTGNIPSSFKKPDNISILSNKGQINLEQENFKIWTDKGWAKVNRIIRHYTDKKIYRVLTGNGCVDVTEDHSLLDQFGQQIKPKDCQVGTELLHSYPGFQSVKCFVNDELIYKTEDKYKAQEKYIYFKSIGYNVEIDIEEKYFVISGKIQSIDVDGNKIKKINLLYEKYNDYVYDIETEFGVFHAGIGSMIIKNTDSTYIHFEHINNARDLWNYSLEVEQEVASLFPRPMKLAFEEKIYWRYFILSKKRYMALKCDLDEKVIKTKNKETGELEDDIFKRGVLLARRDNSKFVQGLYKDLIMKIFYREDKNLVLNFVIDKINELFYYKFPSKSFIITKSVGDLEDYKVRPLPDDPKKRAKRLEELDCTEEEYRIKSLPAHIQLAEKMKRRGKKVDVGTRLEYLVTTNGGWDGKLFDKIEELEYFNEHSSILRIDFLYYLKNSINPIDEAIFVAYKIEKFVERQYKLRVIKHKLCRKIEKAGMSRLNFLE